MAEHWRHTRVTAIIGVGAAFDFHSGNVKRAPAWMRRLACEWLWRLAQEPRRLWPKNLLNPLFIAAVLAQRVAMGYGEKESPDKRADRHPDRWRWSVLRKAKGIRRGERAGVSP